MGGGWRSDQRSKYSTYLDEKFLGSVFLVKLPTATFPFEISALPCGEEVARGKTYDFSDDNRCRVATVEWLAIDW